MTTHRRPPRLVFGLTTAQRSLERWIDSRSGTPGVGAAGAGVLFHLGQHDGALVGEVADALHASASGMSGLISRLCAAGLVAKHNDAHDRRAIRLSLTPAGREALDDARGTLAELNTHLTDGFSPDELDVVGRWLAHVAGMHEGAAPESDAAPSKQQRAIANHGGDAGN